MKFCMTGKKVNKKCIRNPYKYIFDTSVGNNFREKILANALYKTPSQLEQLLKFKYQLL